MQAGADERDALLQVNDQNKIGKAFEQAPAELFLLRHLALELAAFGYVDQSALVANEFAGVVPDCAGGVQKYRCAAILLP